MLPTLALNSQVSYSLGLVASATMSSFKCAYFAAEYFHSLHEASPLAGQIVDKETTTNEREITSPESHSYFIADESLELWSLMLSPSAPGLLCSQMSDNVLSLP